MPELMSIANLQIAVHSLAGYGELALIDELTALATSV
jgi:hypothetical protein